MPQMKLRIRSVLVGSLCVVGAVLAEEESEQPVEIVEEGMGAISRIFGNPFISDSEFEEAIEREAEKGANLQMLLEVRLLRYFSRGEYEKSITLLPDFQERIDSWDISKSVVFGTTEELHGYYNMIRAIDAKNRQDAAALERFVKESFWHYPELGSLLADLIEEYRRAAKLEKLRVPMELFLEESDGGRVSLEELAEGRKAVLLEFWATWCAPCIQLMPELVERAEQIEPEGVLVAAINTESVEKAERFRSAQGIELPWLVEPSGGPLGRLFEVDSLPRAVLFDSEGKVLFNGHPVSPSLSEALGELGVGQ